MSGEGIYLCPVCDKPFDTEDRLFDFALSAHTKEHEPSRNNPANLVRYDDESLMWVCKLCGDPLHPGEYTAHQKVISHCRSKHGSVPGSSAPVTARGGGSGNRRSGAGRVLDVVEDIGEAIGDAVGGALGKILGD